MGKVSLVEVKADFNDQNGDLGLIGAAICHLTGFRGRKLWQKTQRLEYYSNNSTSTLLERQLTLFSNSERMTSGSRQ